MMAWTTRSSLFVNWRRAAPRSCAKTPGVAKYYAEKFGRSGLQLRVLSDPKFTIDPNQAAYYILQRGRPILRTMRSWNKCANDLHWFMPAV
jgi:hypothetical protein